MELYVTSTVDFLMCVCLHTCSTFFFEKGYVLLKQKTTVCVWFPILLVKYLINQWTNLMKLSESNHCLYIYK